MCRADLNFEVDFGVNGDIGTIVTKWDLIVFRQCIVFIHNKKKFKYAAFPTIGLNANLVFCQITLHCIRHAKLGKTQRGLQRDSQELT